jgi:peroxiredoxin
MFLWKLSGEIMRVLTGLSLFLVFSIACFGQQHKIKTMAENFTATSLDGQTFTLDGLKGKVVLVTFWSTRCPICAAEIPKLNELAARYKNTDVVFLGLTTDNQDNVEKYIKKKPFGFNLLPNSFGILLKYADRDGDGNVMIGYPAYYLINQKGEIELKTNGYGKKKKLASEINRLLK